MYRLDIIEIFEQGAQARSEGKTLADNPYGGERNGMLHINWDLGWIDRGDRGDAIGEEIR